MIELCYNMQHTDVDYNNIQKKLTAIVSCITIAVEVVGRYVSGFHLKWYLAVFIGLTNHSYSNNE